MQEAGIVARSADSSQAGFNSQRIPAAVPIRDASVQERKLQKAASEFESILIGTFWKSMKDSFASDDEDATDPAHSTLDDLGIQAMAGAMSKAGGLGLGRLILRHLAPLAEGSAAGVRTGRG